MVATSEVEVRNVDGVGEDETDPVTTSELEVRDVEGIGEDETDPVTTSELDVRDVEGIGEDETNVVATSELEVRDSEGMGEDETDPVATVRDDEGMGEDKTDPVTTVGDVDGVAEEEADDEIRTGNVEVENLVEDMKVEETGVEAGAELPKDVKGIVTGAVSVAGGVPVAACEERFPVGMPCELLDKERDEDCLTAVEDFDTGTDDVDGGLDGRLGGPQLKLTRWIPTSQLDCLESFGIVKVTEVAPPHWEFLTVDPDFEQEVVCLQ